MDDLEERNNIIAKARKKYIPSHTRNITEAFKLYLMNAEKEALPTGKRHSIIITRKTKPKNWIDIIGRPKCPKCNTEMGLRPIMIPKGESNLKGYRSCWECENCGYEKYSDRDIYEEAEFQRPR